jgi:putative zinc finger/helix-turn-helix YgiT family protein
MNSKKARKPRAEVVRARALADDSCPECGKPTRARRAMLKYPVNGEEVTVEHSEHSRCTECGEVVLRLDQARTLRERAHEIYRAHHSLLAAREIRALRERRGMTQGEFAAVLRLGANTLSRWEAGRNVQSAAMDMLLRLIRDVPGSIEYLRRVA